MAGLLGKITAFARTPAGQRALRTATGKARELADDPRTKERIAQVRERIQGRSDGRPSSQEQADRRDGPPSRD